MIVDCLTDEIWTSWGIRYNAINWRPEWYTFIRIQNKEVGPKRDKTGKDWFHYYGPSVHHVIFFFDKYILRRIGIDKEQTLKVRIRIVCGMINKLHYLPRPMKIEFMECIWDTYKKFYKEWHDYYCKKILELPF